MPDQQPYSEDPRDVRRGRVLNELFDAQARGRVVPETALRVADPETTRELREYADLLRELGLASGKLDALIAHGILAKSDDPQYPAKLGPYQVVEYLGRGGMGVVLKAYDEGLRRTVALKILRPELAGDAHALARFTREARAAAALNHPNIVTVHAIGEHDGVHYLAMECVNGPTLAEVIAETYQPSAISDQPVAISSQPVAAEAHTGHVASGLRARREVAADVSSAESDRALSASEGTNGALSASEGTTNQAGNQATRQPGNQTTTRLSPIPNRQSSTVNPDTVRHIFHQLLEALSAAHGAGLIHRDVKSANILLDGWPSSERRSDPSAALRAGSATKPRREDVASGPRAGRENVAAGPRTGRAAADVPAPQSSISNRQSSIVKLADFGLARMITAQTRVTLGDSILGTPEYMSPEQARGDSEIDQRTDLYSAGVVLYEMLTGRTPFKADTPSAVIHQILNVDPPDPRKLDRSIDRSLASLALRLMAKRPEDRFGSAREVLNALEAERRVSLLEQRRRLRRSLTIGLFVVALLLTGTWILSRFDFRSNDRISPSRTARTIADVWVERRDGMRTTRIMVVYEDAVGEEVFHTFPGEVGAVKAVTPVDLDEGGDQVVVAGLERPLNGANVIALDIRGEELWPLDLSNHPQVETWPGCATADYWPSDVLASAQLDNAQGEELIAAAHDNHEYPTRLSIIDPRLPKTLSNFWHTGHISSIQVVPNFFDGQRPAILAWGYNNRLRRIPRGSSDDLEETAEWDVVMAVMVLDPAQLVKQPDGLGPHGLDSHHALVDAIVPAPVHAYAFVGVPDGPATGASLPRAAKSASRICISAVERRLPPRRKDTGDWFTVSIKQPAEADDVQHTAMLVVDHNLQFQKVVLSDEENTTPAFWRQYWHLVIRDGEYVEK